MAFQLGTGKSLDRSANYFIRFGLCLKISSIITPFGAIGLKSDSGIEFKVNGQRLKHYHGEEIIKADTMKLRE